MTTTKDPASRISILQTQREGLVAEVEKFARLLDDPSTSMGEIDSSIEELRAIRFIIIEIDSQVRNLIDIL